MFCKYCGNELSENADVCLKCGKLQKDCGSGQIIVSAKEEFSNKKRVIAGLLALFLGWIGAHNFYVGKVGVAIGQIGLTCAIIICPFLFGGIGQTSGTVEMTFGFFGGWLLSMCLFVALFFWVVIEMICCFTGSYRDVENKKLS